MKALVLLILRIPVFLELLQRPLMADARITSACLDSECQPVARLVHSVSGVSGPCDVNNGGCEQHCRSSDGAAECFCDEGYRLDFTGKQCLDVNECRLLSPAPCDHRCINLPGSFRCACNATYVLSPDDRRSCIRPQDREGPNGSAPFDTSFLRTTKYLVGHCRIQNGGCAHHCAPDASSRSLVRCSCRMGYRLAKDGKECRDVNECARNNGGCEQICKNEPGGFRCACYRGHELHQDRRRCLLMQSTNLRRMEVTASAARSNRTHFIALSRFLKQCPFNRYGRNCEQKCHCHPQHGKCHQRTGHCKCKAGFHGRHCHHRCERGFFGPNCKQRCSCGPNSDGCHKSSGRCFCKKGFSGSDCSISGCPDGYFGPDCLSPCRCMNAARCHNVTGECHCAPGFRGQLCEMSCPEGFYGQDCRRRCSGCDMCHPETGVCLSHFRFNCRGDACRSSLQTCDCEHGSCTMGRCICRPGWQGWRCDEKCPEGKYGQNCRHTCRCTKGRCHPADGRCICPPGYTGARCEQPCSKGLFGHRCEHKCNCSRNSICDHVTGRCQCPTGFEGTRCDTPCRNGYYGPNCNFRCGCTNDAPCDAFTGGCRCLAGFTGPRCENICPPLTAGPYCGLLCQCKNAGTCDPITGYCECPAGFQGKYCERACDDGFFGTSCAFKCSCPTCDPVYGDCLIGRNAREL
ncbi:multiple epidermal growth factor domains protein 6-like [Tropilaelaps mercedesae]|uniref:Multiple epidermal growth factor domains protein 6-like n=1 Tax=Tropilaelaps mercedesae TaxID=418985 RepID=A0A1V9XQ65_9ACAR|nr:multiple epidermal growth factor domains protein 6-like [Tropilaelaps mercedesae]